MKLFGKKKNKNKATPTKAARPEQVREEGYSSKAPQTTVVKYVGESKHVTTNMIDSKGRKVSQTQVIKLTVEEMEELGIVPKSTTPTAAAVASKYNESEDVPNHSPHGDHNDDHSMAGYSMAGYSIGGFSDVLPPPSFQDAAKKQQKQNLKSFQPPPASTNMMVKPLDEASASSSSSPEEESVSLVDEIGLEEQKYQQQQKERRAQEQKLQREARASEERQRQLDEFAAAAAAAATATTGSSTPSSANVSVDNHSASASTSAAEEHMAAIDVTRELVKKFISDIWNRGEVDLIPSVCHPSLRFNGHVGMDRVGHEGFARMVTTVREALTDYHCEIHSMVVESTKAFCRLRFTGKHTGNLLGYPPTGKTVAWMGASEFTCKNGKILKVWELGDLKSLEEQLRSDN